MKLFNRQKSGEESPQITREYYVPDEQVSGSRIDWKRAIPRVLALIVVVAIVIFGVIWAVGALTDDDQPASTKPTKPTASTQRESDNEADQTASSQSGANTSSAAREAEAQAAESESSASSTSSQSAASSAAQQSRSSTTTQTNGKLADSGPGETIALFIATAFLGTLGYHSLQRRKA